MLPAFLREFHGHYPQVQIELREATSDVQLEELLQGQVDAGLLILPLPDKAQAELDFLSVLSEPLILAAPEDLPALQGKSSIALADLAEMPLIIFPRRLAPVFHDAILAYFRAQGLTPRIGQEAIQMQTIIGLVSAGMGIALVPQSVSNLKRPGVAYRPLAAATPWIETGIAWRRDNTSPVLHAFLDSLRKNR